MLIRVDQHTERDLAAWKAAARTDGVVARTRKHRRLVDRAENALLEFVGRGPCYCGVSWGKDSVVVADMVARLCPHIPIVWVHRPVLDVPYCESVRDAFVSKHPSADVHTVEVPLVRRAADAGDVRFRGWRSQWWAPTETGFEIDSKEVGWRRVRERWGDRYISGVRADESTARQLRARRFGESTEHTCAPISRWGPGDVWAYISDHELPVHPSYAMLCGGLLDRDRIRVGSLGGSGGAGHGRLEWEEHYYGWRLAELRALARA